MNSSPPGPPRPSANHFWLLPTILFSTIFSDQLTKYIARSLLLPSMEQHYVGGLVRFSLVENPGGFLGIVSNLPVGLRFFFLNVFVALLLLGCLTYLLWFSKPRSRAWIPLTLITGGGFSNLLDRFISDDGVTDFIILGTGYLQTGIFNLADVFIMVGSFFLGYHLFCRSAIELR